MANPTNFKFKYPVNLTEFITYDLDDLYVRREIFSEGGLFGWGSGANGALGINATADRSSPVQTVSSGTNWEQVSSSTYFPTTTGIKSDGTLWLWGCGANGQLGNNSTLNQSSPVQTVSTGTNWKQVTTGLAYTAALKSDGTLWLWGSGGTGQLGNNSTITSSSPVQTVTTGANWYQVATGHSNSAATKNDGTLWVWGCGANGAIGNNSTINRSSPVQTVSTGTNWKQVSVGFSNLASVKTDGTLWLWGCNLSGVLGNNSSVNQSSPVQTVSTGTNWKQVSITGYHSAAIKTDGTLWLWGDAAFGKLGTNAATYHSSPVQTISTGTNWKKVTTGWNHTAAIKTDGTLWLWGENSCGTLGDNSTINKSSPVQSLVQGYNWKDVNAGCYNTFGIIEDCW